VPLGPGGALIGPSMRFDWRLSEAGNIDFPQLLLYFLIAITYAGYR
jgi:hypothetical protein